MSNQTHQYQTQNTMGTIQRSDSGISFMNERQTYNRIDTPQSDVKIIRTGTTTSDRYQTQPSINRVEGKRYIQNDGHRQVQPQSNGHVYVNQSKRQSEPVVVRRSGTAQYSTHEQPQVREVLSNGVHQTYQKSATNNVIRSEPTTVIRSETQRKSPAKQVTFQDSVHKNPSQITKYNTQAYNTSSNTKLQYVQDPKTGKYYIPNQNQSVQVQSFQQQHTQVQPRIIVGQQSQSILKQSPKRGRSQVGSTERSSDRDRSKEQRRSLERQKLEDQRLKLQEQAFKDMNFQDQKNHYQGILKQKQASVLNKNQQIDQYKSNFKSNLPKYHGKIIKDNMTLEENKICLSNYEDQYNHSIDSSKAVSEQVLKHQQNLLLQLKHQNKILQDRDQVEKSEHAKKVQLLRKELSNLQQFNKDMKVQSSLKNSQQSGQKCEVEYKDFERKQLLEKQKSLDLDQFQLEKEQKQIDLKKQLTQNKINEIEKQIYSKQQDNQHWKWENDQVIKQQKYMEKNEHQESYLWLILLPIILFLVTFEDQVREVYDQSMASFTDLTSKV